jgi:hypothetical protein
MSGGFPITPEWVDATSEQVVYSGTPGLSIPSGSSANAYGAWTTLVAAAPFDVTYMDVVITGPWGAEQGAVQIGVGISGSEAIIAADLVCYSTDVTTYRFPLPCAIPAGARIAARSSSTHASDTQDYLHLILFEGDIGATDAAGVDSIGYVPSSSSGTTIDPGGTAYTKGAYVPLTAATPRDYAGFFLVIDGRAGAMAGVFQALVDIAIGVSGSEILLLPNFSFCAPAADEVWGGSPSPIYWIPIPAGTRISARAASSSNTATSREFGLTLYGIYR